MGKLPGGKREGKQTLHTTVSLSYKGGANGVALERQQAKNRSVKGASKKIPQSYLRQETIRVHKELRAAKLELPQHRKVTEIRQETQARQSTNVS